MPPFVTIYNRGGANLRRARFNIVGMNINDLINLFFLRIECRLPLAVETLDRKYGGSRRRPLNIMA
jgi:hypothetical protein